MKGFTKELVNIFKTPEMSILPGNIAFYVILSLAPLVTLFGLIASLLSLSVNNLVNLVNDVMPTDVANIIIPFIDGSGVNTFNFIFVITGLYIASNSMNSLITASNLLYKVENMSYARKRIKAIILTFFLLLMFVFALILMAFGNLILTNLLNFGFIGELISNHYGIITILKALIAFLIIYMAIKIIYKGSLPRNIKLKDVNKGAFFATIAIILVTSLYSFYVSNIAHYDIIYGSLASIAILMFLIYLIAYIIVIGIIINYNYYVMNKKEDVEHNNTAC